MMQQLEASARSSFEVEMFVSDPETVCLSSANMQKLRECQDDLKGRMDRCIIKANVLRCKIGTLWERLNVDQHIQDIFLAENKGFTPSTIAVVSFICCKSIFNRNIKLLLSSWKRNWHI